MNPSTAFQENGLPSHVLRMLVRALLIGALLWMGSAVRVAAANADSEGSFLDSLLLGEWKHHPERLDSLTSMLRADGATLSCERIQRIRSEIAFECMVGGQSDYLMELIETHDRCTPLSGGFAYCMASIHFNRNNYHEAAVHYQRALNLLETGHYLAVNAQFNLAASLHHTGDHDAAIELLKELVLPDSKWSDHVSLQSVTFRNVIKINAAGMMVSNLQHHDALDILSEVDRETLDPYWRTLGDCNRYMALKGAGQFEQADSLWLANIQFIPYDDLPEGVMRNTMDSVLATNQKDYLDGMRSAMSSGRLSVENLDPRWYAALLASNLPEEQFEQNWELLRTTTEEKRRELRASLAYSANQLNGDSLNDIQMHLDQASERIANWQWIALIMLIISAAIALIWWSKVRLKQRTINAAMAQVESESNPFKTERLAEQPMHVSLNDIRSLHEAIIKGSRIGEALRVVRKLEILQDEHEKEQQDMAFDAIPGIESLTPLELTVLRLAARSIPTKEMAIQLALSVGHINNARSSIRSKLEIPSTERLSTWLHMAMLR